MNKELDKEEEIIARLDQIEREILVGMGILFEGLFANADELKERYNEAISRGPDEQ